ncbi:hypothetical protein [uncultured Tessaracoccus sp.]|uniref:hypothetical protein n=1 Tax=uncultured Tessaracoccus sp. TaxID=905023 RepID=UPI002639D63D|nr:hypothetical protein [uncultured Tessaracoccus sp.]
MIEAAGYSTTGRRRASPQPTIEWATQSPYRDAPVKVTQYSHAFAEEGVSGQFSETKVDIGLADGCDVVSIRPLRGLLDHLGSLISMIE